MSSHSSHGKLTLGCAPGRRAKKLGLTQQFVCMQVFLHKGAKFSVELCVLDSSMTSRRLRFSNSFRDVVKSTLHVQLPFNPGRLVPEGDWCTLCFDVVDLVYSNFKGNSFRAVDGIVLTGTFKLRQVFTLRAPPLDCFKSVEERIALKNAQATPKAHNFPIALKDRPMNVMVRMDSILDTLQHNECRDATDTKAPSNGGEQGFTVAFGSRIRTPIKKETRNPVKSTKANRTKSSQQRELPARVKSSKQPRKQLTRPTSPAVPEVDEHEQSDPRQDELLDEALEDERFFDDEFKSDVEEEGAGSPNQSSSKELDFPFDEGHFDEVEAVISKLEAAEESDAGQGVHEDGTEQEMDDAGTNPSEEDKPNDYVVEEGPLSKSPSTLDELLDNAATEEHKGQEEETKVGRSSNQCSPKLSPTRDSGEASFHVKNPKDEAKCAGDAAEAIPEDDEIKGLEDNVDSESDCDVLKELGGDKTEDEIMRRFNEKRAELEELEESLAADLALEEAARQAAHEESLTKVSVDNNRDSVDEDEDLELIYDPILCCYFCPKTNKYYSMKADS